MAWTDERADDFARHTEAEFQRIHADFGQMRVDIGSLRAETRTEIRGLRGEMRGEISGLRGEMRGRGDVLEAFAAVDRAINRIGAGIIVALVGASVAMILGGPQ